MITRSSNGHVDFCLVQRYGGYDIDIKSGPTVSTSSGCSTVDIVDTAHLFVESTGLTGTCFYVYPDFPLDFHSDRLGHEKLTARFVQFGR